jgi:polyhydroxyalkanoate synthase subunit PhaC
MLGLEMSSGGLRLKESWETVRKNGFTPAFLKNLQVGATPHREVFRRGNLRLICYEMPGENPGAAVPTQAPVLFLPSLINRHYILDLLPGRSLVGHLLADGFPVYMVEWLAPSAEDRYLEFDDLFRRRISQAIERVLLDAGSEGLHLVGHCLGGTLAIMEALLRPSRLKTLTLLTAPVDFTDAGKLGKWAKSAEFDLDALTDAYGNVPWPLLQGSFQCLRPSLPFSKWARLMDKWRDPEFCLSFLAMEMWSSDNIAFPGQCYKVLIRDLYQRNALARGEFRLEGNRLSLSGLGLPVLDVVAMDDHIVPPATRLPMVVGESTSGAGVHRIDLTGGHVGAVLGRRAQQTLWPEMSTWLKSQDPKTH